jgi:hypothetical protein
MKKIISIIFLVALLGSCTTYDGAAYIRKDLESMNCSSKSAQTIDIQTAKTGCINSIVDDEYFKGGAAWVTIDSIRSVNRYKYDGCMSDKGFLCDWGPSGKK